MIYQKADPTDQLFFYLLFYQDKIKCIRIENSYRNILKFYSKIVKIFYLLRQTRCS